MQTYKNKHLNVKAEFPSHWSIISWKHGNISKEWQDIYQSTDDEYPKLNDSKFLFTAYHMEKDQISTKCGIEVSIYNMEETKNFTELMYGKNAKDIQTCNIGNRTFYFKEQELNKFSKTNFYWSNLTNNFWLYIKTSYYGQENKGELLDVLQTMTDC
ncbi:hypothetical protein [Marinobacter sp. SS21]|uniref:hypothetical protein n=1 Tax=Marinobacter sp. SS21 TaxID=2979460 RepID=UPI00232EF8E0|nr:hypothetical protein [Marinobacter sp. SS21]MDC0664105.1 hypothetical protein [Marinobacter sp. SS21]